MRADYKVHRSARCPPIRWSVKLFGNVAAQEAAALAERIVAGGAVPGAAVIPDQRIADAPFVACLELRLAAPCIDFFQQCLGFVIGHAGDPDGVNGIDENRVPARFRMTTDDRMLDQRLVPVGPDG